jgi:WD40 repeat protein
VVSVAFSANGGTLAAGLADGKVCLCDAATGKRLTEFTAVDGDLAAVAVSPDGSIVAAANRRGLVSLRSSASLQPIIPDFRAHWSAANVLAFSPDGKSLATASQQVRVWDLRGKLLQVLGSFSEPVRFLSYSPDGACLIAGSEHGSVRVWSLPGGELVSGISGPQKEAVAGMALGPDGRTFAIAYRDRRIQLLDVATGQHLGEPIHHRNEVHGLAFSPDGKTMATVERLGAVKLWNLLTRQEVGDLRGHFCSASCVAFSPDGQCLATGGAWPDGGGELYLWMAHP